MELEALRQNWNRFGEIDPLGAILTEAGTTGRSSPERFFEIVAAAGSEPPQARSRAEPGPVIEVYGTPRKEVVDLLEEAGARVVDVHRYDAAGPQWRSFRYVAEKR